VTIDIPTVWSSANGRWETPDGKFFFDAGAADKACDFFPDLLRHHIGEFVGKPFELLEYQKKLLTRPIFGWKRVDGGFRRFRKLFGFLPKGAGKSPWAAGTGIYLARCDGEAAAEIYAVANDRQQARTVHDNAKVMIEQSAYLLKGCEILKDAIYWKATRSTYMVLSSEASTAHGKRPHGFIFDELHGQRNRDLYEALKKSLIKRRQPVLIIITHAGTDDEGICFEEYELAKSVLGGGNPDETCLPVIFEMKSTDDWTSPAVHARTNPGYGITVKPDAITAECAEAQSEPRKQNDFKRYHGNVWVNQATAWIPVEWWDACDAPMPSIEELAKFPCAAGIDMAQKIDLAAADVVFKLPLEDPTAAPIAQDVVIEEPETGQIRQRTLSLDYRIAIVPAFWLPDETLKDRVRQDNIRYDVFRDQRDTFGFPLLNVVEGAIVGADAIVAHLMGRKGQDNGLRDKFPRLKSAEFGYDPAFATEVALALRDGHGCTTVEVLQNYKHLSEACQVFEALVKARRVIHGGHRLLRWNLENVAVKTDDAGRIRPVKPRKATKRIDGIVAAIIALSRIMTMPVERQRRRGVARVWTPGGFVPIGESPSGGAHP
jgi:phage terminase large subunit-like protein